MVKKDHYPIDVTDLYQYEIYGDKLLHLPDFIDDNIKFLEKDLNIEISNRIAYDDSFFKSFNEAIKRVDLKKNKKSYIFSLSILLGEIIIKNKGAHWKINKQYGVYNPYYVPVIVMNDNEVELEVMKKIMDDIYNPKFFDLKFSYNFLIDPRFNMQLNPDAQKIYQDIKKGRLGNNDN